MTREERKNEALATETAEVELTMVDIRKIMGQLNIAESKCPQELLHTVIAKEA
jgi:hypothetical protein